MCVIDLFTKYEWVVPLKDKRGITIVNAFQKIISKECKPNKISRIKRFFEINSIEMYLTYNEGKSVVVERFIRTMKNKIFKHMTAVSKNVFFDLLDDIVNKYNHTVHKTIKMKPIEVTSNSYAENNEDSNESESKLGDRVRISKHLLKDTLKIGQKKFLLLAKLRIQFRGLVLLVIWIVNQSQEVLWKRIAKN